MRRADTRLRLICAVPYAGMERAWLPPWKIAFQAVLAQADHIRTFYPSYTAASFHVRNRWMVDHAVRVIAVYNGSPGGTRNTVVYARKRQIQVCTLPG